MGKCYTYRIDWLGIILERFTMNDLTEETEKNDQPALSRRGALIKLGLAAGVTTYVAPLLTNLNQAEAESCRPPMRFFAGHCV